MAVGEGATGTTETLTPSGVTFLATTTDHFSPWSATILPRMLKMLDMHKMFERLPMTLRNEFGIRLVGSRTPALGPWGGW